jgi:hypothetical protein
MGGQGERGYCWQELVCGGGGAEGTYLFTICNVFIDSLSWISAMNQFCPDCPGQHPGLIVTVLYRTVLFPVVLSGGILVIYFLK